MSETVPLDLSVDRVRVFLDGEIVGSLTLSPAKTVAFSYESSWLSSGFSISPLSLPLREGVFVAKRDPLHGLFGVFDDSMPDGWGAFAHGSSSAPERNRPLLYRNLDEAVHCGIKRYGSLGI